MGQQKEKRKALRSPVSIRIDYSTVDQFLWNFASNINEGGLFVESSNPLDVGTVVQLKFYLPNIGSPINATGEVIWTGRNESDSPGEESDPRKQGMGIRFKNLDEQSKAAINHLVKELRNK
ncbi:MAG: TIGR02266 family protein [bacterium]